MGSFVGSFVGLAWYGHEKKVRLRVIIRRLCKWIVGATHSCWLVEEHRNRRRKKERYLLLV